MQISVASLMLTMETLSVIIIARLHQLTKIHLHLLPPPHHSPHQTSCVMYDLSWEWLKNFGQSYKAPTIVIYIVRVVNIENLLVKVRLGMSRNLHYQIGPSKKCSAEFYSRLTTLL